MSQTGSLKQPRVYDFATMALINIFSHPYATVCDLYCGGATDSDKWSDAKIGHYIGIDSHSSAIHQLRQAWEEILRKSYTADFFDLDPCMENIELHLKEKLNTADCVCCLHHLQLCFETEEKAQRLLHNVSSLLKPGGYFVGITPDSSTIWFPFFGKKYQLKFANDASSETQCLVHFPSLIRSFLTS